MPAPSDPRYHYCPRVRKDVVVCRNESDCRTEHGCGPLGVCPIESCFGLEVFDQRMRVFATTLDLWPLRNSTPPDVP